MQMEKIQAPSFYARLRNIGASDVITVPKKWIKNHDLHSNDELEVLIVARRHSAEEESETGDAQSQKSQTGWLHSPEFQFSIAEEAVG